MSDVDLRYRSQELLIRRGPPAPGPGLHKPRTKASAEGGRRGRVGALPEASQRSSQTHGSPSSRRRAPPTVVRRATPQHHRRAAEACANPPGIWPQRPSVPEVRSRSIQGPSEAGPEGRSGLHRPEPVDGHCARGPEEAENGRERASEPTNSTLTEHVSAMRRASVQRPGRGRGRLLADTRPIQGGAGAGRASSSGGPRPAATRFHVGSWPWTRHQSTAGSGAMQDRSDPPASPEAGRA